jgi:hypothetical protein
VRAIKRSRRASAFLGSILRDAAAPRGVLAGSNPRSPVEICQAPCLRYESVLPHSASLPLQNPKRYLAGFIARLGILKIESKNRKSLAQRRGFLFERKDIAVPCATIVMTAFVSTNDSLVRMNASLVRMSASFMRMNASLVSTSDLTWPESHSPFMHTNASLMSTNDGFVLTKQTDRAANRYLLSTLSTADKSLKTSHSKKSMKNFSTISVSRALGQQTEPLIVPRAPTSRLRASGCRETYRPPAINRRPRVTTDLFWNEIERQIPLSNQIDACRNGGATVVQKQGEGQQNLIRKGQTAPPGKSKFPARSASSSEPPLPEL